MLSCNRSLSPLQRRSMQLFGCNLIFAVALTTVARMVNEDRHLAPPLAWLLAIAPAIPVAGTVAVVGRYLKRETDEFVRSLVVQSLLWGLGVTMVTDTVLGGLLQNHGSLLPILNIDLFCVTAMLALRIQLWRNQ